MSVTTESAESAQAVSGAVGEHPCLEIEGSKVYAELSADGVLVIRACPAGDTPVAVLVDETLVAGSGAGWGPRGRHHRPADPGQGSQ